MSLMSAPYWWVQCDATGCDNRCPTADSEVTAWIKPDHAEADATEADWRQDHVGRWFCDEHPRCEDCDEPIDDPDLAWWEGLAFHRACINPQHVDMADVGAEWWERQRKREAATHLLDGCPCPRPCCHTTGPNHHHPACQEESKWLEAQKAAYR